MKPYRTEAFLPSVDIVMQVRFPSWIKGTFEKFEPMLGSDRQFVRRAVATASKVIARVFIALRQVNRSGLLYGDIKQIKRRSLLLYV